MNRVVTGYHENGNPAVIRQGEPPVVIHAGRYTTTELWVSARGPLVAADVDASTRVWALEPPPGGACFRIVEIAPDPGDDELSAEHASPIRPPGRPVGCGQRTAPSAAPMVAVMASCGAGRAEGAAGPEARSGPERSSAPQITAPAPKMAAATQNPVV